MDLARHLPIRSERGEMDDLNVLAGEVADRMLGAGNHDRRSRLFRDLKEMALQALRNTRSGHIVDTKLAQQSRSNALPGDLRGLWRVPSF
jgi:hypothetical protein